MNLFLKEKVLVQREKYLYEAEITLLLFVKQIVVYDFLHIIGDLVLK